MIKKEFRDIWLPVLLRFAIVLIVPIFQMISKTTHSIVTTAAWALPYIILLIAHDLGFNSFKWEKTDRAFEYLFAFPQSKWRLLFLKIMPRGLILMIMVIIYELSFFIGLKPAIYGDPGTALSGAPYALYFPEFFPIWVAFIFINGFVFSLFEWKKMRALICFACIAVAVVISLTIHFLLVKYNVVFHYKFHFRLAVYDMSAACLEAMSFLFGGFLVLLIVGIGFYRVYNLFDSRDNSNHLKRFLLWALLPLVPCLLTAALLLFSLHVKN